MLKRIATRYTAKRDDEVWLPVEAENGVPEDRRAWLHAEEVVVMNGPGADPPERGYLLLSSDYLYFWAGRIKSSIPLSRVVWAEWDEGLRGLAVGYADPFERGVVLRNVYRVSLPGQSNASAKVLFRDFATKLKAAYEECTPEDKESAWWPSDGRPGVGVRGHQDAPASQPGSDHCQPGPMLMAADRVGASAAPPQRLTIPVMYAGPVEFIRDSNGEVGFNLDPATDNWLVPGIVVRLGYLELTKHQLRSGQDDVWRPDMLADARRELDLEDVRSDAEGRDIRIVIVEGKAVAFVRSSDGTISVVADVERADSRPKSALRALSEHLDMKSAPLHLTMLQLRRGETLWFPDLRTQALHDLQRDGFRVEA